MYHDIHPCHVTAQGDPHVFAQGSQYSRVDVIGWRCMPPIMCTWNEIRCTDSLMLSLPIAWDDSMSFCITFCKKRTEVYRISLGSLPDWWAFTTSSDKMELLTVLHDNLWSSRRTTAPHTSRSSSLTSAPLLQSLANTQGAASYQPAGQHLKAQTLPQSIAQPERVNAQLSLLIIF